jgi:2-C-methyl-D-erythritol 4-phosphate cytidylyltransferase
MGLGYSKAYADVAGRPVLALTLEALLASPFIDQVTVASRPGEEELCRREVVDRFGMSDTVAVIAGGQERQHTIQNLIASAPPQRDIVLIHDGARPLVSPRVIRDVLEAAVEWGAAIAAVPVIDTVKETVDGGETVARTLDRSTIYRAQTPQAFHMDLIATTHRRALKEGWKVTDDASLIEQMGHDVRLVEGDERNFKVTNLDDLELLRLIVQSRGR